MEQLRFYADAPAFGLPFAIDPALIALSLVSAAVASGVALEALRRLASPKKMERRLWRAAGVMALGVGVWCALCAGILSLQPPVERAFDVAFVAGSAAVMTAAAGLAFVILRGAVSGMRLVGGGLTIGLGLAASTLLLLLAQRVEAEIYLQRNAVALAAALALAWSAASLWLALGGTGRLRFVGGVIGLMIASCGAYGVAAAGSGVVLGVGFSAAAPGALASVGALQTAVTVCLGLTALLGMAASYASGPPVADTGREVTQLRREIARRNAELRVSADHLDAVLNRAAKANSAKSDFLASMSHELRTPLNSILGFTQLLQEGKNFGQLDARQSGAIQQIDHAGRHLLSLIDEILDLSQIEAGRLNLVIEPVNVAPMIEEVTAMLQPAAIEAGVTLHMAAPPEQVSAKADRKRLQQIMINLVSNAIKYNRRGGEVTVRWRASDVATHIVVRDTGMGIPEEHMNHLFEPFNRLGQEQSATVGNGVGLALCKRLVEAMYGSIRAHSKEGVGSLFSVALPPAGPAGAQPAKKPAQTVLYVEDNPSNVLLMRHIVAELDGVELAVATNPHDGIDIARATKPALILLDINLPQLDGFEVLRILREDVATSGIPVFAVTANAMPREVSRGKMAGFNRYITKPLNVTKLTNEISKTLRLSRRVGVDDPEPGDVDEDAQTLELTREDARSADRMRRKRPQAS